MTDQSIVAMQGKHPLVIYSEKFEQRTQEIKNMLPPGISPERFIRAARTAAQLNPDILACTWTSIWNSAVKACREGLLPDGIHAAFVPYKNTCTFVPMVRGRLLQFQQSGAVRWVTANVVYEGDEFEHWIDEHGEHLRHKPGDTFDDKKIVRAYAMATTKDSGQQPYIAVMSRAEIDKHRSFSRTKRDDAPWVVHYAEMAKKTLLHRLAKGMPNGPMLDDDYSNDEEEEETRPQLAAVNPNRERGAAAALDAFAGSPEGMASLDDGDASDAKGETGGGGDIQQGAPVDMGRPVESAAAADAPAATAAEPLAVAHARGVESKAKGHQRKALPPEYRTPERDAEAQSWLQGWDGK